MVASSNAAQGYKIAQQALAPTDSVKAKLSTDEASPLADGIQSFSEIFAKVETATEDLAKGEADPQSVVVALANAEVALEAAVTIRNRIVEAYQELLRMPV